MRQEPNNEIDLLLRQLSRRNGIPVSEFDEPHLDADELNSYVANALPAATRARYTEHLADCSSCRKLVAQLSAAQGPVAVQQDASIFAPSGWKSFLAGLFSPMVLRYAVPALGLIVIAGVGIFVFRQGRSEESIAQLSKANSPVAASPATSNSPTNDSLESSSETKQSYVDTQPVGRMAEAKRDGAKEISKEAPVTTNQPADAAGTSAGPTPAAPKAAVAEEAPPAQVDLVKKKEAAGQTAGGHDRAKQREEETVKNETRKDETVRVTPGNVTRRDIQVQTARAPSPAGAVQNSKRAPEETKARASDETKDSDAATETRTVAGRRFRKSGGVWIDTDYDSPRSTINVARGSEQYRALVADEPPIRTIAEQLAGDIIVVWKGRAYRIR